MSRDKRGNRTPEVDGSSPFSSTNIIKVLTNARNDHMRDLDGHLIEVGQLVRLTPV